VRASSPASRLNVTINNVFPYFAKETHAQALSGGLSCVFLSLTSGAKFDIVGKSILYSDGMERVMSKAIAVVAIQENPYKAAVESAANFFHLVIDFMYGTPERSRFTYMFAIGLGILGVALSASEGVAALQACPI
jgi:hypothetical protein